MMGQRYKGAKTIKPRCVRMARRCPDPSELEMMSLHRP